MRSLTGLVPRARRHRQHDSGSLRLEPTTERHSLRRQRAQRRSGLRSVIVEPTASPAGSHEDFQPPRPLRAAVIPLAPVPLLVGLWVSGVVQTLAALAFGVFVLLLALVRAGLGVYDLHRCRRLGDALLRAYPGLPPVSGLAAWRSTELTSTRRRRQLTRFVRQLRREIHLCTGSDASLARVTVLDESDSLLRRLERRLEFSSVPVSPVGMLELHALAADDFSPLYFPERAGGLPAALAQALAALEPA